MNSFRRHIPQWCTLAALLCLISTLITIRIRIDAVTQTRESAVIFIPVSHAIDHQLAAADSHREAASPLTAVEPETFATVLAAILGQDEQGADASRREELKRLLADCRMLRAEQRELRNRRHHLNTALMDAGFNLAAALDDKQLDFVLDNRDVNAWRHVDQEFWTNILHTLGG
ncbi:hypothetical protein JW905_05675 [bacterium]|nr:hypothetical protein [candidate division CSSED10-310 bacterium]